MFSCLPVSLFSDIISSRMSVADWSREAAALQLDGFDISILFVKDRTADGLIRLRREIDTGGLPLMMVATYPDFTNPDPEMRDAQLQQSCKDIEICAELGASYVRITAGQWYPEVSVQQQLDSACAALEQCARVAERCGIRLLWENHSKPGAWSRPDFDFDTERFLSLYRRLAGGPIRLNYDIANAYLLGHGPEWIAPFMGSIASVHINDVASVSPMRFAAVGDGMAPIQASLQTLHDLHFDGLYSLEEASMGGLNGLRRNVEATRRMLKNSAKISTV